MNFIVVVDEQYGIAKAGKLLAHIPGDLNYFKEKTLNHVVVMGRKTLESLPGGKPLPYRKTVVLTRDEAYKADGVQVVHSIEALLVLCKTYPEDHIFIAGGGQIYQQLMPYCKIGYITKIHSTYGADTFLDNVDATPNWHKVWESETKTHKHINYTFTTYENSLLR